MNTAAATAKQKYSAINVPGRHPNELDLRRITRLLEKRVRYRYVTPTVDGYGDGYRIQSPCCSRNVDAEGGIIDIAWIEYDLLHDCWKLYRKAHAHARWQYVLQAQQLAEVMDYLNEDPTRVFWQ